MKQEIILEVNRFHANMLMNLDGDGNDDETSQQKNSSKNLKSHSSGNASYDQVCTALHATVCTAMVRLGVLELDNNLEWGCKSEKKCACPKIPIVTILISLIEI